MSAPPSRAALKLAIIISGRGSNMLAIADACAAQRINARIALVIADRASAAGLQAARERQLATQLIEARGFANREQFEASMAESIDQSGADLIVLAGFMRILGAPFCRRYEGRLVNIHPALLPAYKGLHTHQRAIEAGETVHGATVHFVTPELDDGPSLLQARVPIMPGDTETSLSARVQRQEHRIYPEVIGWIATGRLQWRERRPWLDGKLLECPVVIET